METINHSDNATDFAQKVNANFSDLSNQINEGGGVDSTISNKGYFGANYPTQMRDIMEFEMNKSDLHFIHVTDTHDSRVAFNNIVTGSAGLLNNSFADFLVHTGDAVADSIEDVPANGFHWNDIINGESKPCYFVLGNHECYKSTSLQQRYDTYFSQLNWASQVEEQGKTYYHVDVVKGKSKYKCLFLDYTDGGLLSGKADTPTNWSINTSMSDEQKLWFIQQLQAAAQNDFHVVCFVHVEPDVMPSKNASTTDDSFAKGWIYSSPSAFENVFHDAGILCGIIDAFLNGSSYTFNGTEYTFSKNGYFVGWFCGHVHSDGYAWSPSHPNQFINIAIKTSNYLGGSACWDIYNCKYVSVDYNQRKVTIYNAGHQYTASGRKKIMFTYNY